MNKETKDLRKLSNVELLKKRKEVTDLLIGCHNGVAPLVPPSQRVKVRKIIAKINTIMKERQLVEKQE